MSDDVNWQRAGLPCKDENREALKGKLDKVLAGINKGEGARNALGPPPSCIRDWKMAVLDRLGAEHRSGRGLGSQALRATLLAILCHVNGKGEAHPGQLRLAGACAVSDRQIRSNIQALQKMGWIKKAGRKGFNGVTIWRFNWPLPNLPPRKRQNREPETNTAAPARPEARGAEVLDFRSTVDAPAAKGGPET